MECDATAKTTRKFCCQLIASQFSYHSPTISTLDMDSKIVLFFVQIAAVSMAHMIRVTNNCPFTVWPGIQGNPRQQHLENGGFSLDAYKTHFILSSPTWAGRIWGRTNCDSRGKCETGDCGNKIQCNGTLGVPPLSLVEIQFAKSNIYYVSLVDGFNLPIRITPNKYQVESKNSTDCKSANCVANLNSKCPTKLAVNAADGSGVVACKSACALFNTDSDCCKGVYTTPATCNSRSWPQNYPPFFKEACPDAYSYPFDNTTSTFSCRGSSLTKFDIIFCP
ncbi:PREDICTED: thaumatin-like protein 1b [Diuraphis noxia]|uniref:thaumatin-like protein 1b n=1 Tax=Diuraphis noxia TaxID=143948 RepID=UPI00076358A1|nr:PREDICTED: thaumatin-like protein 1b [Diuraphis noxia]